MRVFKTIMNSLTHLFTRIFVFADTLDLENGIGRLSPPLLLMNDRPYLLKSVLIMTYFR